MMRTICPLLSLGIAIGSIACKDDGDDAPADSGFPDLGPKDTGVDTGVDGGVDTGVDTGTDTGVDAGEDSGTEDTGPMDAGNQGPGVLFRVFDTDGDPLAAEIEVNGSTYTTDGAGVAFIPNLSGEHVFRVSSPGHETTPFSYLIPDASRVLIDATLNPFAPFVMLDDAMNETFGQGAIAQVFADSFETEAGADITGMYEARLASIDVSVAAQVLGAPLPFVGRDLQGTEHTLEAFTIFVVEARQNGMPIRLKAGEMIAVTLRLPESFVNLVQVNDVVPAWSYDETTGRWVQEMDGTIQTSPFGSRLWYGFFTHFSWWAIARPFEAACMEARASDASGPVSGALVRAVGLDHGYVGTQFSDTNGSACVSIKPGGNVAVSAIHESFASLATPVTVTGNLTPGECGGGTCSQAPLTLEGAACAEGLVRDEQGAGYPNARIQLKYRNSSGQSVSSFTTTDAQGGYCALGTGDSTVVASDAALADSATVAITGAEAICGTNCSPVSDLILADIVGGCVHGTGFIYNGMGNPTAQAPAGTPVYVYSGNIFGPNCTAGMDDPATWGTLEQTTTVGANGAFCISAIPLGPTIVVLGDCTVWPADNCGPSSVSFPLNDLAVCGQPGCRDLGPIRYNLICDGS